MEEKELNTLMNLTIVLIAWFFGIISLIGVIFCSAWWHLITIAISFAIGYAFYVDEEYDTESVKHWIHRKLAKK